MCHDRSKRCSYLHPSSSEVPEVCFWGQKPTNTVLPLALHSHPTLSQLNHIEDWLILARSEWLAVRHRDVVLAHMKELGLRLDAKKSVHSPVQRTTYLGVVWDWTTMQARMSPARIESILTAVARVREGRSLTVKQSRRLLGLMAAASNVNTIGLLYMRSLQRWLKTKGFSPRGNPLRMLKVTRRCLRALDMWRKPWFLSQGPVLGAPCRRVMLATDASLTGWGAVMSGHPARGLWSGHHLTWHINCLEMLAVLRAPGPERSSCVGAHRQHSGGLLHQPPRRSALTPFVQTSVPDPCVVPGRTPLAESSPHSWSSNMGTDILLRQGPRPGEWRLHTEVMKQSWRGWPDSGGSVCDSRDIALSPLASSDSSSSTGAGRHGTDVAFLGAETASST